VHYRFPSMPFRLSSSVDPLFVSTFAFVPYRLFCSSNNLRPLYLWWTLSSTRQKSDIKAEGERVESFLGRRSFSAFILIQLHLDQISTPDILACCLSRVLLFQTAITILYEQSLNVRQPHARWRSWLPMLTNLFDCYSRLSA
jgi:hypothetical protein